jgi:tetratricopeptide (TPR) repeat protein
VQFGLKKYSEAEPMYKRLLALWELVGGADHPMLSLTLDKMVEFYLEQKRYEEAAPLSKRALAIRAKETIETLHRSGRILTGQKRIDEATDVYGRALRIAADAGVPDDEIPGMLKAYALLLRQKQREKEALVVDKRLKDATDRKAEKEGKRTMPPSRPGN